MIGKKMLYGSAYYPEHWDKKRWATDVKMMKQAGFNVVRMGEFAWCFFEPREGTFEFGWMDEALDLLASAGIAAILGTPTATIPAWMAKKYPHVMAADAGGTRRLFGVRKDYCVNQADFLRLGLRMVEQMARRYGRDKRVIGFQTDNEFGSSPCRCELCLGEFRAFLKKRYKTIDALNKAWGCWFWGTMYGGFDEVGWPPAAPNPSQALDAKRFFSLVDVRHQAKQIEILRKHAPAKPITHNFMGLFPAMEYYDLAAPLDFASWDNYPRNNTGNGIGRISLAHAVTWSLKRDSFVVMEQQAGPGGWDCYWGGTAPGEMKMLAWQAVARGADGIVYFRWRTSVSGQEQYWHGILNHDGQPRRRYHEVADMGREVAELSKHIIGTTPAADVAILNDYDQIWATEIQKQNREDPVSFQDVMNDFATTLTALGVDYAVVSRHDDYAKYKVLLCPPLYLSDPAFAKKLAAYVRGGGRLVLTARSGAKDVNNRCLYESLPGPFGAIAGIEVDEYDIVAKDSAWQVELAESGRIAAARIREHVLPMPGTEIVAVHRGGFMEGWPAITRKKTAKGCAVYVGTLPRGNDWRGIVEPLLDDAGLSRRGDLPQGVEIARREGPRKKLTFILNHTAEPKTVELGAGTFKDLLNGGTAGGHLQLPPYGVVVLDGRL